MSKTPGIELYRSPSGGFELAVQTDAESVWLSADQLVALFGRDKSTISRHLRNVFADGELNRESVVAEIATTASDGKTYPVTHYNLDVIISVGYRVKSLEGVRFRRWATNVLRRYLVEGVAFDPRRLEQLGSIVRVLSRSTDELVAGVAEVVDRYLPSLRSLRAYDEGDIPPVAGSDPTWQLSYGEARALIDQVRDEFPADTLFGGERGDALHSVVATLYQGFGGVELYPSVELKAANLLYLVVKDHPLTDGNKRSAAALFVHFLQRNGMLVDVNGVTRVSNNALAAITLMVAMSDPREKELMIALIASMLTDGGE